MPNTGWTLDNLGRLDGTRILITGPTNGIGLEAARAFAAAGASLILAARNIERARELAKEWDAKADVVQLDLSDLESVTRCADSISGEIDILINNAGAFQTSRQETADGFEKTIGVNFLGPFALTARLLPKIRQRIVILGSIAHNWAKIDLDDPHFRRRRFYSSKAYPQSKLADMVWGVELRRRLEKANSPIEVMMAHPGYAMTNLQSVSASKSVNKMVALLSAPLTQDRAAGALPTVYAATQKIPSGSYVGPNGRWNLRGRPVLNRFADHVLDPEVGQQLWQWAETETGVTYPL